MRRKEDRQITRDIAYSIGLFEQAERSGIRTVPLDWNHFVRSWAETTDAEKLIFGVRGRWLKWNGRTLSRSTFRRNVEARVRVDFPCFRNRLARKLKKHTGMDIQFVIAADIASGGRRHIHGVLAAGGATEDALREALQEAGGDWAHRKGRKRQVHLQPFDVRQGDAWARYILRDKGARRPWARSHSVTRVAKKLYAERREEVNAWIKREKGERNGKE